MSAVLKPSTEPFFGEILDADGHLYMPPDLLVEITKEVGAGPNIDFYRHHWASDEYKRDRAVNRDQLWSIKGLPALGSFDAAERVEAMDMMGVKKQLLFTNTGGLELRVDSDAARIVCSRYNDYAIDFTKKTRGRAVAAVEINMHDHDWAIKELERVLKAGTKCINLPCNAPPGGVAPSHSKWDPFWARLQEADVPATLHLACAGLISSREKGDFMFPQHAWGEAETLRNKPAMRGGGEEAISPYFMLVAHMGAEVYLQTMIMGKVFDRFPKLRFGIIESSAAWVGPCVERMDLWSTFMNKVGVKYDIKPSETMRRNVRVTPFWHENLPQIVERYGLEECWVFSTDYPHLEGSRDPIGKFRAHIEKIGKPGYDRKFFVDNVKLLFPDN
jgi:predicted TIM-barrel fold metal-dependent hydrolase